MKRVFLAAFLLMGTVGHAALPAINPAIMIFHDGDWDHCEARAAQAAADGAKRVNFVFTLQFVPYGKSQILAGYCYPQKNGGCLPIRSKEMVADYTKKLESCFQSAVNHGLDISVTPHIDDYAQQSNWRNNFSFDPSDPGSFGLSYSQVLLQPILNAVNTIPLTTDVEYSLEGEMGATIGNYAGEYSRMLVSMKQVSHANIRYGISLNFNKVFGDDFAITNEKKINIQKLINQVDYLGFSNYHAVEYPVIPSNFDTNVYAFVDELDQLGIRILPGKNLQFTESGIGGGHGDEVTPSTNPEVSASMPYSGVRGEYRKKTDPWKTPDMKSLRLQYYQALSDFLANQTLPWKVTRAFTWSSDSWDVNGIYSAQYRDEKIVDLIKEHNQK